MVKKLSKEAIVKNVENVDEKELDRILKKYIDEGLLKKEYDVNCSNCFRQLDLTEISGSSSVRECIYCGREEGEFEYYEVERYKLTRRA